MQAGRARLQGSSSRTAIIDGFNWDNLRFFLALARAGNPSAAARLLRIDHNTVRRHINALEHELDVRLFDPRPDRYALTDEGEILLQIAEDMEGAAASAQNRIASREIGIFGTVRIGVPDGLGTFFVAPRLARLRQQHPGLQIELVVTSRHFNLSRREADMALVVGRPEGKRIRVNKMTDVTMRLYGSESYLAGKPAITSIDDLADHDFVSGVDEFDFGHALNRVTQDDVPTFVARIACTSVVAQLKAVATGSGLCYFANFIAGTEPGLVRVLPEQVSFSREVWLATHSDLSELARIRTVENFLVEEFASEPQLFD